MELQYINITQKGLTYFVSVVDALSIVNKINVDRRSNERTDQTVYDLLKIEENIKEINEKKLGKGLQRELMPSKVKEIKEYLSGELGLIPNSIIVNISDPLGLVVFKENTITIPEDESIVLTALDGQHRLEGIKEYIKDFKNEKYEIPLTLFYNSQLEFQAYLFSTINSKQTKINKSFLYDLLALSSNQIDEFKLSHEIAYWLNDSNDSVLKDNFKLLGKGPGWLSQAAFIDFLLPNLFLSEKKDTSNVIFKKYLKQKKYDKIADFVNDYFDVIIRDVYKDEFYSDDYIFKTSFIFGVFMKIMPYSFIYSLNLDSFEYDKAKLKETINCIKSSNFDFKKGGVNSGVGSYGRQNKIVQEIIEIFKTKCDIDGLTKRFKEKNK